MARKKRKNAKKKTHRKHHKIAGTKKHKKWGGVKKHKRRVSGIGSLSALVASPLMGMAVAGIAGYFAGKKSNQS